MIVHDVFSLKETGPRPGLLLFLLPELFDLLPSSHLWERRAYPELAKDEVRRRRVRATLFGSGLFRLTRVRSGCIL